jgi:hypothetical protein
MWGLEGSSNAVPILERKSFDTVQVLQYWVWWCDLMKHIKNYEHGSPVEPLKRRAAYTHGAGGAGGRTVSKGWFSALRVNIDAHMVHSSEFLMYH